MKKTKWILVLAVILILLSDSHPQHKQKIFSREKYYDQICSGNSSYGENDSNQLIDEYAFGYCKGRVYLNEYLLANEIGIHGNTLYTIGLLFDADELDFLSRFPFPLSIKIGGVEWQEEYLADPSFQFSRDQSYDIDRGKILKKISISSKNILLTFSFPTADILSSFSFQYTEKDIPFKRIQLSLGDSDHFPAFSPKARPPCMKTTAALNTDQYYDLNLNKLSKAEFVKTISGGILGYDKENDEYLRPELYLDELTESIDDWRYKRIILKVDNGKEEKKLTVFVRSYDDVDPVILQKSNHKLSFPYYQATKNDILDSFNVRDVTAITKYYVDQYPPILIPADYQINIIAIDSFSNRTSYPVNITIYDDRPPKLEVPDYIQVSQNDPLSENDLREFIRAEDEIDGTTEVALDYKKYQEDCRNPGNHTISVKSKDRSGNESSKDLNISVKEGGNLSFIICSNEVTTYFGHSIDVLTAINKMSENRVIPEGNYVAYSILSGFNPDKDEMKVGDYISKVSAVSDDGANCIVNLKIHVLEEDKNRNFEESIWEKISNFFAHVVNTITAFFKKLFV